MEQTRRPTLTTEMSITIRQDGEDIHTNGALGDRSVALLRALLQLKVGQEPHAEPHQPPPQKDEEDMRRGVVKALTLVEPQQGMRAATFGALADAALAYLRIQGLLRTPEDARLVAELRQCNDCVGTLRLEHEQLTRANAKLEERAEKAEATLAEKAAAWAEWSTKAQADLDAANKELTELRALRVEDGATITRLRQDRDITQAQYEREKAAREAAQKAEQSLRTALELSRERVVNLEAAVRVAPRWSESGLPVVQEHWDNVVKDMQAIRAEKERLEGVLGVTP